MTWLIIAANMVLAGAVLITARMISKQLVVIHDLVNSNLTRVTADFEIARRRIETLEAHITQSRK